MTAPARALGWRPKGLTPEGVSYIKANIEKQRPIVRGELRTRSQVSLPGTMYRAPTNQRRGPKGLTP
jgi:hypothetical protein